MKNVPRILLVSGVPPGSGNVGEIILRDLLLRYPPDSLACFIVPFENSSLSPDPGLRCVEFHSRRYEVPLRLPCGKAGAVAAAASMRLFFARHVKKLAARAVELGRRARVDKVWMVLESPTVIAMGTEVAGKLEVPLLSLVWDPPEYLLRERGYDRFTRKALLKLFAGIVRSSEKVGVVSESMCEDYRRMYSADTMILRQALPCERKPQELPRSSSGDTFSIGFAGSLYCPSAWQALMDALETAGWSLHGRRVVVRALGSSFRFSSRCGARIEYLGFRSTAETAAILGECDVTYLPYPFEPSLRDLVYYAFPTKLSTYVVTGRPVFIHAPEYSSLARFHARYPVGACCTSLDPGEILPLLSRLAGDADHYARASRAVEEVALKELNREESLRRFDEFIGLKWGEGRCAG